MTKTTLSVTGMHCTGCSMGIEAMLKADKAIKSASVSYATEKATIEYDENKTTLDKIIKVLSKAGYSATESQKKK